MKTAMKISSNENCARYKIFLLERGKIQLKMDFSVFKLPTFIFRFHFIDLVPQIGNYKERYATQKFKKLWTILCQQSMSTMT